MEHEWALVVALAVGGVIAFAGWRMGRRSARDRSLSYAQRAGARDARRNIPSSTTGNPSPTPAMRRIVKRWRQRSAELDGEYGSRQAYAESNHDVTELQVETLRKQHAAGRRGVEPLLEAAERAATVSQRALGDILERRARAQESLKQATAAELEEYRRANIAGRRSEDRLLLDQLLVPDLDDPVWTS